MFTVIQSAEVFAPQPLGCCDVLLSGDKIVAVQPDIDIAGLQPFGVQVVDAKGKRVVPGLVDSLVHITGGGGEGGFMTRTPELEPAAALQAGVTTMVGCLGTDAITRTLPELIAKAYFLREHGLSCYCYTGSYEIPARTVTQSVEDDIVLIEPVIGVGEVAIADHRSSQPTVQELARLASQARRGGLLAGKAGVVSVHVGDNVDRLDLLHGVCRLTGLPHTQFYPTHINRTAEVLDAGIKFAECGGTIDFTASTSPELLAAGDIPAAKAAWLALKAGIAFTQITFSSDGQASLPAFNESGELEHLAVARMDSLLESVRVGINEHELEVSQVLAMVTANPARELRLAHKGQLKPGNDADLLILDAQMNLCTTIAMGQIHDFNT